MKKFENRSTFGEDMDKSLWRTFLVHPVYSLLASGIAIYAVFFNILATGTDIGHYCLVSGARLSLSVSYRIVRCCLQ